mgnify:CR=1 FL=1
MNFIRWCFHFVKYKSAIADHVAIFQWGDKFKIYRKYKDKWYYHVTFEKNLTAFAKFLDLVAEGPMSDHYFRMQRRVPKVLDLTLKFTHKDELLLKMLDEDPMAMDLLEDVLAGAPV